MQLRRSTVTADAVRRLRLNDGATLSTIMRVRGDVTSLEHVLAHSAYRQFHTTDGRARDAGRGGVC